jgi:RNA polymerase sigma factor (sigma-70 family)
MCRDHDQEAQDPAHQIEKLLPALDTILRRLWIRYRNHPGSQRQQMEDHYQNLVLFLIEDDYRRLRSHDRNSSLHAWLKTVAEHYLANCLRGQVPAGDWSEVPSGALSVEARQETEIIYRERVELLQEVFGQLSDHERLLGNLLRSEAETGEIAQALKIEPRQVRKRRYELVKKIRKRLAEGGARTGEN